MGSSSWLTSDVLRFQGNLDFFLNSVNWLSGREEELTIRPRSPEYRLVQLTGASAYGHLLRHRDPDAPVTVLADRRRGLVEEALTMKRFTPTWIVILVAIVLGTVTVWTLRRAEESPRARRAAALPPLTRNP
jgi:ABC-type uncharacterized transport system involved in gliding motility auxiliary subunit